MLGKTEEWAIQGKRMTVKRPAGGRGGRAGGAAHPIAMICGVMYSRSRPRLSGVFAKGWVAGPAPASGSLPPYPKREATKDIESETASQNCRRNPLNASGQAVSHIRWLIRRLQSGS